MKTRLMRFLSIFTFFFSFNLVTAGSNSEFRATWVITWDHIDRYKSVEQNKANVRRIMDNHVKANMNAVLWQARQSGTAYYNSNIEPWGYYAGGRYPGYDPLAYAIEQAHRRGLELHAWVNVFHTSSMEPGTPAYEHPEWVCTNRDGVFMTKHRCLSPGIEAVREYTVNVIMEIVQNYDVDGIHLDFVRWNEYDEDDMQQELTTEQEISVLDGQFIAKKLRKRLDPTGSKRFIFDSEHPFSAGVPAGFNNWDDWRRWSVTEFVRMTEEAVHSVKPWVRISAAALGNYKWGSWQGYGYVFQDAALWFNKGYIDQLTPMHYHWTDASGFWNMLVGPNGDSQYDACWGKYIQPGIKAGRLYTVGPGSYILQENGVFKNHEPIVKKVRQIPWVDGFQFFSYATWRDENYWQTAAKKFFTSKSKIRASALSDSTAPEPPTINVTQIDTFNYKIRITPPDMGDEAGWFVLYRSSDSLVDRNSARVVDVHFGKSEYATLDRILDGGSRLYYAATVCDRSWNESALSNIVPIGFVPIYSFKPQAITLEYVIKNEQGYVIKWKPSGEHDTKGYRLYGKQAADEEWQELLDESVLDSTATTATLPDLPGNGWLFMVRAVSLGAKNLLSDEPSAYGAGGVSDQRILIIDAFDRRSGSWQQRAQPFTARVCEALARAGASYDCTSNEVFRTREFDPKQYRAVFWLTGDESRGNETIDFTSISMLANYMRSGGQMLVSGSNLGYDLDQFGSSTTKRFFHDYLKAVYKANGYHGNGYLVHGQPGTIFEGLDLNFDDGSYGFDIKFPDVIDSTGGSIPCLKYEAGDWTAAIQYQGPVGSSTTPTRVITLGFPFEAIYNAEQLDAFLQRVLNYFEFTTPTGIADVTEAPENYNLIRVYPNPFNSSTTIQFGLQQEAHVELQIYNIEGQRVRELLNAKVRAGRHRVTWDASAISSGVYYCRLKLQTGHNTDVRWAKMLYLK